MNQNVVAKQEKKHESSQKYQCLKLYAKILQNKDILVYMESCPAINK